MNQWARFSSGARIEFLRSLVAEQLEVPMESITNKTILGSGGDFGMVAMLAGVNVSLTQESTFDDLLKQFNLS